MKPRTEEIEWDVLEVTDASEYDIPDRLNYWMVEEFDDILPRVSD